MYQLKANSNDISKPNLWKELRKTRTTKYAFRVIIFMILISVLGVFIANDRPIYCKVAGETYFPVFNSLGTELGLTKTKIPVAGKDWYELTYESALWPMIPFAGNTLDIEHPYQSPFTGAKKNDRFRHLLGTGMLGKDVAAGLVQGTRLAMFIGIVSIFLAALIGLLIGGFAGYFGDHSVRLSWLSIVGLILGVLAFIFYGPLFFHLSHVYATSIFMQTLSFLLSVSGAALIGVIIFLLFYFVDKKLNIRSKQFIPLDILLMRFIEIVQSVPALLILLVLAAMFSSRSIWIVIFIIAFIKWAGIAKFVRAELLQIRSMPYIQAARATGISELRILWRHGIPNALTPIYIAMAFGIGGAILLEATISFLGIGLEQEIMSWGKMLSQARQKPSAWWLAIFPGFMIFVCVISFNLIGDRLSKLFKSV